MTKEEAVAKLNALGPPNPSEEAVDHAVAEDILCAFLRSNDAAEIADAFEAASTRVGFYYS
jgi:hypothetical protein